METLREYRVCFTSLLPNLITKAQELGLEVAFGELQRSPAVAALYEKQGLGVAKSAHINSLAIDLALYRKGKYLELTEDYAALGAYWKTLHPLCRWGGDFSKLKDGNHFSLEYKGVQ